MYDYFFVWIPGSGAKNLDVYSYLKPFSELQTIVVVRLSHQTSSAEKKDKTMGRNMTQLEMSNHHFHTKLSLAGCSWRNDKYFNMTIIS